MLTDEEINAMADRIATQIMSVGDIGNLKAKRMQFMLGKYGDESPGGGLNKIGLKLELAKILKRELVAK
jgi:hypothetical protein